MPTTTVDINNDTQRKKKQEKRGSWERMKRSKEREEWEGEIVAAKNKKRA